MKQWLNENDWIWVWVIPFLVIVAIKGAIAADITPEKDIRTKYYVQVGQGPGSSVREYQDIVNFKMGEWGTTLERKSGSRVYLQNTPVAVYEGDGD